MRPLEDILAEAASRKGGLAALEAMLGETPVLPRDRIAALPDHRILAAMTRRIFSAGFSAQVIDAKWPAFESAFREFDPPACAALTEDDIDALAADRAIVRNRAKIDAVRVNAALLLALAREHGSAARVLADWPEDDLVGLLRLLRERGRHLGGDSGMRVLRAIGKPAFVTTRDVVAALIREGVVARAPSTPRGLALVQRAFNLWSAQSGRNLTEISRILALSVPS
ncbi:DNA-3-methyladenine glycosylase I [Methylobacterium sp. 17Sr1-1]|uniref:DNA-3-methyladenine glycosylase I n=1 Tax=Methylobacterium sp. 17Sr1-1 TaxID=2202826 RepID=UPI000D70114D|nr:DNA-3-methyladenine glycosylase I [Methylobacterium sp. 17Sr1-1]AWN54989.1 3-methyladenine DNA glycosylase [Methylobacterium sp. 17Sr1-1]